jgi:hypothetical protein
MSMYTQLLDVAYGRCGQLGASTQDAVDEVLRCRGELTALCPEGADFVPITLARQIGYDVALLDLAAALGIETDPSRFEQPWRERARLEHAIRARGIDVG